MLALLNTWQNGDISLVRDEGDLEKALKSIQAKGLIMPSKTDLYFPVSSHINVQQSTSTKRKFQPEDSSYEVSVLKNAKLVIIPSVWGHVGGLISTTLARLISTQIRVAGGGANPVDVAFTSARIKEFLEE